MCFTYNEYSNLVKTLRFHSCGVKAKNVTLGVPRIKELIDLTKNMKTPSMKLIIRKEFDGHATELQSMLIHIALGDAVKNLRIIKEPDFFECSISPTDADIARRLRAVCTAPAQCCPWMGRIELNAAIILQKGLTPARIACDITRQYPIHAAASQESDILFILHLRPLLITPGSTSYPQGSQDEDNALKTATETLILRICRETRLSGIKNIIEASLTKEIMYSLDEHGDVQKENVSVIETQGSCLSSVLGLEYFRSDVCTSNDVHNVYNVLGVEAAAAVLFDQIRQTLTFDGSYTNERHLLLLCSFCTSQSILLPISRHGINRSADSGALSRASFEEVSDQLLEAAAYGDVDYTTAFSPAIMVGQRAANTGTGICYAIPDTYEEEEYESSEDDIIFTSVDADNEMLSYQDEFSHIELPYSDVGKGVGMPTILQHTFMPAPSDDTRIYAPTSPKTRMSEMKNYTPSSPTTLD